MAQYWKQAMLATRRGMLRTIARASHTGERRWRTITGVRKVRVVATTTNDPA